MMCRDELVFGLASDLYEARKKIDNIDNDLYEASKKIVNLEHALYELRIKYGTTICDLYEARKKIDNIDNDKKVLPFRIDAENGYEYWLGDKNFYVITRYNHSIRYAMTAWMLAEAIKTEVTDSLTPSTENK